MPLYETGKHGPSGGHKERGGGKRTKEMVEGGNGHRQGRMKRSEILRTLFFERPQRLKKRKDGRRTSGLGVTETLTM